MYKIIIEKECSCFKKSDLQNNIEMGSKDQALLKALKMKNQMNQEFCRKHDFSVKEKDNNFIISFELNKESSATCCGTGCCG